MPIPALTSGAILQCKDWQFKVIGAEIKQPWPGHRARLTGKIVLESLQTGKRRAVKPEDIERLMEVKA